MKQQKRPIKRGNSDALLDEGMLMYRRALVKLKFVENFNGTSFFLPQRMVVCRAGMVVLTTAFADGAECREHYQTFPAKYCEIAGPCEDV